MNYRNYYFERHGSLVKTFKVQVKAIDYKDTTDILQEFNIRARDPEEALKFSITIRNEKLESDSTLTCICDMSGKIILTKRNLFDGLERLKIKMPSFKVKIIREAGLDLLGENWYEYAEDHLRIHALTAQEAHQLANFICCISFKGQIRRTIIENLEHFDEKY